MICKHTMTFCKRHIIHIFLFLLLNQGAGALGQPADPHGAAVLDVAEHAAEDAADLPPDSLELGDLQGFLSFSFLLLFSLCSSSSSYVYVYIYIYISIHIHIFLPVSMPSYSKVDQESDPIRF